MEKIVMGILVGDREQEALRVQELLTKHGCVIKTRLGLHETENICSIKGLILLEFKKDSDEEVASLKAELEKLESIKVRTMEF